MVIRENVTLAPCTSFGIGGPARYFTEAMGTEEFTAALRFAMEKAIPWYILGGGTNVLVSDRGFPGLVIRTRPDGIWVENGRIMARSGCPLSSVVDRAATAGLSGLEHLAGIPGTVGGAIRGNAGAFGSAIGDMVTEVLALDSETLKDIRYRREECHFSYRGSIFKENRGLVIISAALDLATAKPEMIRRTMEQILIKRGANLEKERSVGSYFMNPRATTARLVREFEEDRKVVCRNCTIPAGWFIDRAGLRGTRVGGAMVSTHHGNYLINTGSATAEEMLRLARLVKERVLEKLGIELQEEVNYLGFHEPEGG